MIDRAELEHSIRTALARSRGVVLSGPRQSGKSTLAGKFLSRQSLNYFDLEYPPHAQRLEQPAQALESLKGLVVIDEVQLKPDLFPLLRTLIDRHERSAQLLLLGSASPLLMQQSSESLAGRLSLLCMGGLTLAEVLDAKQSQAAQTNELWLRGGFPRASRLWSKAGFYQAGGAFGFRDQLQDSLAFAVVAPERLRD